MRVPSLRQLPMDMQWILTREPFYVVFISRQPHLLEKPFFILYIPLCDKHFKFV